MHDSTAIFACHDVVKTIDFYKEVLGFTDSWVYGEPPTFGSASCQGVSLMFCRQPSIADHIEGHQHFIRVKDVEGLYQEHIKRGAQVVEELETRPWGIREYTLRDLNGYHLRFTKSHMPATKASEPTPESIHLAHRKPSEEEYKKVAGTVFGNKTLPENQLSSTWSGIVATLPDHGAVGVLRIMQDAPGWFSIWDVAVLPEWQYRGIGSLMMEAAIKAINEASPHAIVYLFTFRHDFYARFGFAQDSVTFLRL